MRRRSNRRQQRRWHRWGLRLSEAKTRICHIDEGVDFLGFRIQRQPKRGNPGRRAVYTWPSKKALAAGKAKVRALTRAGSNQPLAALLGHLNRVLRGWTAYFRYGVSKRTFDYLGQFTWNRVLRWLRRKHPKASWGWLRRRYLPRWWPTHGTTELLRCGHVTVRRYRYRGAQVPRRGRRPGEPTAQRHGLVESRMRGNSHVRFGGAGRGNGSPEKATPRPGPTLLAGLAAGQPPADRPLRTPRRPAAGVSASGVCADLRPQTPTVVKPPLSSETVARRLFGV